MNNVMDELSRVIVRHCTGTEGIFRIAPNVSVTKPEASVPCCMQGFLPRCPVALLSCYPSVTRPLCSAAFHSSNYLPALPPLFSICSVAQTSSLIRCLTHMHDVRTRGKCDGTDQ